MNETPGVGEITLSPEAKRWEETKAVLRGTLAVGEEITGLEGRMRKDERVHPSDRQATGILSQFLFENVIFPVNRAALEGRITELDVPLNIKELNATLNETKGRIPAYQYSAEGAEQVAYSEDQSTVGQLERFLLSRDVNPFSGVDVTRRENGNYFRQTMPTRIPGVSMVIEHENNNGLTTKVTGRLAGEATKGRLPAMQQVIKQLPNAASSNA